MELNVAINQKIPIDIDLLPSRDIIYSGVCLKANTYICLLVNFDEDTKEFDGFTAFRNKEISRYRIWTEEEIKEIKNDNLSEYLTILSVKRINTFYSLLKELINQDLVAVFTGDDETLWDVGKILSVERKIIKMRLISKNGKWLKTKTFQIADMNMISFQTKYEKQLIMNAT